MLTITQRLLAKLAQRGLAQGITLRDVQERCDRYGWQGSAAGFFERSRVYCKTFRVERGEIVLQLTPWQAAQLSNYQGQGLPPAIPPTILEQRPSELVDPIDRATWPDASAHYITIQGTGGTYKPLLNNAIHAILGQALVDAGIADPVFYGWERYQRLTFGLPGAGGEEACHLHQLKPEHLDGLRLAWHYYHKVENVFHNPGGYTETPAIVPAWGVWALDRVSAAPVGALPSYTRMDANCDRSQRGEQLWPQDQHFGRTRRGGSLLDTDGATLARGKVNDLVRAAVLGKVRAGGPAGVKERDAKQALRRTAKEEIDQAINELLAEGLIRRETRETGGRPSVMLVESGF